MISNAQGINTPWWWCGATLALAKLKLSLLRWILAGAALSSIAQTLDAPTEFARRMNIGKACLENRNAAQAMEAFTAALELQPKSVPALRNLARGQLLADQNEQALESLKKIEGQETNSPATSYLTALAHIHRGRIEEAIPHLEQAVRLAPQIPTLRFQLAVAYQLAKQQEKALDQFRETVRLDPLHASAHFKLGAFAIQAGDRAEFERRQAEFQRLRKLFGDDARTPAALERCVYTLPESAPVNPGVPDPGIQMRFVEVSDEVFPDEGTRAGSAAAVLDVHADGTYALLVAGADDAPALLTMTPQGRFLKRSLDLLFAGQPTFHSCIVGDFHDDVPASVKYDPETHALNDVFLLGTNRACLLKRTGPNSFSDVTDSSGLASVSGWSACWVDYDHDGDLDLLVAAQQRLQLWQNQGNGTFTNVEAQVGLDELNSARSVTAVDLDSNVATDVVVAQLSQPTLVFMNQRTGRFGRVTEPPGPWPPAQHVLSNDLDNDGRMDVLCVGERHAVVIYGGQALRQQLDFPDLEVAASVFLDFDNDGWLDLCLAGVQRREPGRGLIRLWRNAAGSWSDVTAAVGLARDQWPALQGLVAGDLDNDGDSDLLVLTRSHRMHFLRNDGGNLNYQLKLQLLGTKTNPSGLGAHAEIRAGPFRVARSVQTLPIEIGLGRQTQVDTIQTIWANGIVDNEIAVKLRRTPLKIVEKNVAAGSCPYLYAWTGQHFRFVTDLLGNSPLGLSIQRDTVLPADPEELVFIGTDKEFRPRDGAYELQITEELREVLYLDTAQLLAVDHPVDMEVHSTDKLGPPPFLPSEVWLLKSRRPPLRATGDDGIDRTEALQAIDGVLATPGTPLPPPLRGMCQPLTLTMDFGPLAYGGDGVVNPGLRKDAPADHYSAEPSNSSPTQRGSAEPSRVLVLTGWLQYGDASVNIAASQNASLAMIPPRLEAEAAPGQWVPLHVTVGLPAGKTKTIVCDLTGKLPAPARRLRLTTTFEVRWDRIALFERAPDSAMRIRRLLPDRAQLYWRGFSEIRSRAPGHPPTPEFDLVSSRPPWRTTPEGWCTRYGEVLDLITDCDERLVLVNAGDALRLRFEPIALPPIPSGQTRSFYFYSVGWDKDADHNVVAGDHVEPLPVRAPGDWELEYNTRWVPRDRFALPRQAAGSFE